MKRKLVIGEDILLKLTALLLAILVWFAVGRGTTPLRFGEKERSLLVNTTVKGLDDDLIAIGIPPQVEVLVSGDSASLETLAFQVKAGVSLKGLREGRHIVDVVVSAPRGIRVLGVSPRTVSCEIERRS